MSVKQGPNRPKTKIQQTRDAIRCSWSGDERKRRRQTAEARQQWLLSVLFPQPATVPARVA